jgi:hypothetical protein
VLGHGRWNEGLNSGLKYKFIWPLNISDSENRISKQPRGVRFCRRCQSATMKYHLPSGRSHQRYTADRSCPTGYQPILSQDACPVRHFLVSERGETGINYITGDVRSSRGRPASPLILPKAITSYKTQVTTSCYTRNNIRVPERFRR